MAHRQGVGLSIEPPPILAQHPGVAEHDIFVAAILGNEAAVRRFVERDPERATSTGQLYDWDPLTYLCFSRYLRLDRSRSDGLVRTARFLLEHGASANTGFYSQDHEPDPSLETVIYGAAGVARHAELTRLLLDHGADPNDGETPYHAPEGYDNAALKMLVESGKVDADGLVTMLTRKHDWHDYEGIEWLLQHGADPNRLSRWGRKSLHQALERNNPARFIELLLDHGADPKLLNGAGKSPIALAARMGRADVLELFGRRGFSAELEGGDGVLAACARGDASAATALASHDPGIVASLEAEDPGLLADVAGSGNTDAVRIMLDLGFNVASRTNRAGSRSDTALHVAIWRSRHAIAKLLIERGAPLEVTNKGGETPLAHAVRGFMHSEWTADRSLETISVLLTAGAQVDSVKPFPTGDAEVDRLLQTYRTTP